MSTNQITERNGKRVVIPEAAEVAAALEALPAGQQSDLAVVRRSIAEAHGVDQCCPVTMQRLLVGFSETGDAPYWRVVDPDKPFANRLVGGGERVRAQLAAEK